MTNKNIIPVPHTLNKENKLLRRGAVPPGANPEKRLIAAVIYQACLDYFRPCKDTTAKVRNSAHSFFLSEDCHDFLDWLGISEAKIQATLRPEETRRP